MQSVTKILNLILVFCLAGSLMSCGNKLTREKAQDLISKSLGYPKDEKITFYLSPSPYQIHEADYNELIDSGYVSAPQHLKSTPTYFIPNGLDYINIPITAKGAAYMRGKDQFEGNTPHWMMKGAESYVANITGIAEGSDKKTCEVTYVIAYRGINAFGRFYKRLNNYPNLFTQTESRKAYLRLYDDGWRVEKQ